VQNDFASTVSGSSLEIETNSAAGTKLGAGFADATNVDTTEGVLDVDLFQPMAVVSFLLGGD
jgi:hypothetical protein